MTDENEDFWSETEGKGQNIIQNITYNIQDSAISGDINNNVTPKDD